MSRAALSAAALTLSLALAGCATTADRAGLRGPVSGEAVFGRTSSYGLFLAGEAALKAGRNDEAAAYFARASTGGDEDGVIREKAFTAALMAGDYALAQTLAPAEGQVSTPTAQRLAQLVGAVDALARGQGRAAYAGLHAVPDGPYASAMRLIRPWTAAAAGDREASLTVTQAREDRLTRSAAQLGQALLFERAGRHEDAESAYRMLTASPQGRALYAEPYGAFLERRGRRGEAAALYRSVLERQPDDRGFERALARVEARRPAPALPDVKQGAGDMLFRAAEIAILQRRNETAEIYLRLALRLNPQRHAPWLLIGDLRAAAREEEAALDAFSRIPKDSPLWLTAQNRIVLVHQRAGRGEAALALARSVAAAQPRNRDAQLVLASLLRMSRRYEEAAEVLTAVLPAAPGPSDWSLYFDRGTAFDRAGRWPEAEADLVKALQLKPDDPDVLNYLGYSWVVRGERMDEAVAMIQKAVAAQPNSGEIQDSLGWAYYQMGDFERAVQRLERAVALEPINAEINDHLGDAYWRVGRRIEAEFQWKRVLTLNPDADLKAAAERKLAGGLEGRPPASVALQ